MNAYVQATSTNLTLLRDSLAKFNLLRDEIGIKIFENFLRLRRNRVKMRTYYNSDEDTEDASESEMPKYKYEFSSPVNNNFIELREQMYLDKLNNLREQLYQLDTGVHPEYLKQLKRVETQRQDRMLLNEAFQIHETERIEREYINEKKAALREFEDRKIELRESLILELEDRKKMIENERATMELLSDCTDTKPVTTRKLRRRPNEPVPVPDKRRRTSPAQLNHQLEDKDILEDLKVIRKA